MIPAVRDGDKHLQKELRNQNGTTIMKTIGIHHTKGGVGKSAVTVFLADFLSSLYDKRVLVVDLDQQNNAAGGLVGSEMIEKAFAENLSLPRLLDEATRGEPNQESSI